MSELRRCPFCGGEATVWRGNIDNDTWDVYYDVYCTACNCMTPKFHTEKSAIKFWNRREPIDRIVEQLEEAKYWTDPHYDEDGYSCDDEEEVILFDDAIEIVKKGGAV